METNVVSLDEKKNVKTNLFVPKTISESIRITSDNAGSISLIDTSGSPALRSDLNYILTTSGKGRFSGLLSPFKRIFSFRRKVTTEYFLTYHQREEDEPKRSGRKKNKAAVFRFLGDEILHVIRFGMRWRNRPYLYFLTDFEVGGTRYNRDFLQKEGFIPLERFIGKGSPKWILIGAGSAAGIQEIKEENVAEKYLVIPGKINFRFWERIGFSEYTYKMYSSSQFLQEHPSIRKSARLNNVETVILISEKVLVLERVDSSWRNVASIYFKTLKEHKDISLTFAGTFFFNLGSGIQQGAIINSILQMMDTFGILILLTWLMQYIYPNIVYTLSVILSADRFDKIKSAEKDDQTEPAIINLEIKRVLSNVAVYSILSVMLLLAIYPGFFVKGIASLLAAKIIVSVVYIGSTFFRDWTTTFEQDALFRILKRSLSGDKKLYKSILKINAFAYSGSILFNLIGIGIGWAAMNANPVLGVSLAVAGALLAFTKLLYPKWGNDYNVALYMNVSPFHGNDREIILIPNRVSIRSSSPLKVHSLKSGKIIYDNANFEIVCHDREYIPVIKERTHSRFSPCAKTWLFTWRDGNKKKIMIKLISKDRKNPFSVGEFSFAGTVIYRPVL
jgi:hypothetical protein